MSTQIAERFQVSIQGRLVTCLALPDIRQATDHDCGDASVSVVLRFLGAAGRGKVATPIDGTDPRTLESVFWRAGLPVQSGRMDVADLRYHTRRGRPVVCLVTHGGTGHWVVVGGVVRGGVYYQCPSEGPKRERTAVFAERWRDGSDRLGTVWAGWGVAVG